MSGSDAFGTRSSQRG